MSRASGFPKGSLLDVVRCPPSQQVVGNVVCASDAWCRACGTVNRIQRDRKRRDFREATRLESAIETHRDYISRETLAVDFGRGAVLRLRGRRGDRRHGDHVLVGCGIERQAPVAAWATRDEVAERP